MLLALCLSWQTFVALPLTQVRLKTLPPVPVQKPAKRTGSDSDGAAASASAPAAAPLDRSGLRRSASGQGMTSLESAKQRRELGVAALTASDVVHSLQRQLSAAQRKLAAEKAAAAASGGARSGSSSGAGLISSSSGSPASAASQMGLLPWNNGSKAAVDDSVSRWLQNQPAAGSAAAASEDVPDGPRG